MKPRSKKATKEELERYARLKELGCIVGRLFGSGCLRLGCEIQHLTSGGRRISNYHTIPLCPWHHRAQLSSAWLTARSATNLYGPSFAISRRAFEETYGAEEFLLAETNKLLSSLEHPDWLQIPKFLRRGDD